MDPLLGMNTLPGMGTGTETGGMLNQYPFMQRLQQMQRQQQRPQQPGMLANNQFKMPAGGLMGMAGGQMQPQGLLGMMMGGGGGGGLLSSLFGGGAGAPGAPMSLAPPAAAPTGGMGLGGFY